MPLVQVGRGIDRTVVPELEELSRVDLEMEMRGRAEGVAGSAEAIPLCDGTLEAVVCAQAFHWFRAAEAGEEIHRILRPGGSLIVRRYHSRKVARSKKPNASANASNAATTSSKRRRGFHCSMRDLPLL